MKMQLKINGMHCASCKALIEDVAKDIAGVKSCTIDLAAGTASIEHDDGFNPSDFAAEVAKLGEYQILPL